MGTPNGLYDRGRQAFLENTVSWSSDNIKIVLVDLDTYGATCKAVTGATNATPVVVTATSHGFSNGDIVANAYFGGNAAANGFYKVANVTTNTFELTDRITGVNIAGSGAYTSGGFSTRVSGDLNLSDIAGGARIATSTNLSSKTVTDGVADAADVTFTSVSGAVSEALVIYKDTGTASTSRLIAFIASATNLPVTPNTGDIIVAFDNGPNKVFRL